MKQPRPVSVWFVAVASGALHIAMAIVFVPLLSILMLSFGAHAASFHNLIAAEQGMVCFVAAPFIYGATGFAGGALMAFLFNLFVRSLVPREPPAVRIVVEPSVEARRATVGDAA